MDIDGVLATSRMYAGWKLGTDPGQLIDPGCLLNLKALFEYHPSIKMVLSSSWRCHNDMRRKLAAQFRANGILVWREEVSRVQYDRQDEINDHIIANFHDSDRFIILDDIEMEYEHLRRWQVLCSYSKGFDEERLVEAKLLVDRIVSGPLSNHY